MYYLYVKDGDNTLYYEGDGGWVIRRWSAYPEDIEVISPMWVEFFSSYQNAMQEKKRVQPNASCWGTVKIGKIDGEELYNVLEHLCTTIIDQRKRTDDLKSHLRVALKNG